MPFHPKRERPSVDGSDFEDSPAKPARRVVLACLECRNRRCKCDGAQPSCSNCLKHGRPACQYKAVTAEENLQARRRKNLVDHTRVHAVAGSSKAHRSAAQRRSKAPRRTRDEGEEDNEEDAEGEDDEEYTPLSVVKTVKRRRISSSSSSSSSLVPGSSSTHTPIPVLPLPSSLPDSIDTFSTVAQEHTHQPVYYSCQPAHSLSLALSPFTPAGVVASPYPTPFSPPTTSTNLGTPQQASHQASHPPFFPFHYPSAPQQQFVLFQPPPSSPPSAYHHPLPYSQPDYSQRRYMVSQPLPTPYWSNPSSAEGGYPFPTSFGTPMASNYSYVSTGAPGALGIEVPYPIYEAQHTVNYPNTSAFPPYSCSTPSFVPPAPTTTSAPPPVHPIESPVQLPTPSSGASSPTLTSAPINGGFEFSLGLGEVDVPLQVTATIASKMERQWSQQQEYQRVGSPFTLAGTEAEWTC